MPRMNPLWAGIALNLLVVGALGAGLYRLNQRVDQLASVITMLPQAAPHPAPAKPSLIAAAVAPPEPAAITRVREVKRAGFVRGREICDKLGLTEERVVMAVASLVVHVRDFQRAQDEMRAQGSLDGASLAAYVEAETGDIKAQMQRLPLSQAEMKALVGEEPALRPFASL